MKNYLILIALCFTISLNAQFGGITKDPFNLAVNTAIKKINIKNLSENVASKKKLIDMLKIYNDWNKNIIDVNTLIRSSQTVIDIKDISVELGVKLGLYNAKIDIVRNISQEDKQVVKEYYRIIVNDGISELSEFNNIIGEGLKMNDFERLTLLKKIKGKMRTQLRLLDYLNKKVNYSINKRKQQQNEDDFFKIKL